MKTLILTVLALLFSCTEMMGQDSDAYTKSDSIKIERILKEAAKMPDNTQPVLYFARKFLDVPYVSHTLELPGKERLVVNTRQLDCLTFVETVTSLSICHAQGKTSFKDYCNILRNLRYRGGKTDGYTSRIHYSSEWITDNKKMGYVDVIDAPHELFSAKGIVDVWFMGKNPDKYKKLTENKSDISKIREMEKRVSGQHFRYIPKNKIKNTQLMRKTIHDGDILEIVTSIPGLDIAHVGFAAWHKDGLHLINASSIHHKVVEEPMTLYRYMQKHPKQKGIRVLRIR